MSPERKQSPVKLQSWRVSIIGKRGEYLGTAEGRDREGSEAPAIKQFQLSDHQRTGGSRTR
ncbi:MAG TPA: hypothetical protein VIZ87_02520 [Terrimicrobium sp.]